MKRFTKSLLTLALLVVGVVGGAKAQTETDVKDLQAANGTTEQWVASIPESYPTSPIDVKDSQTIFGSDASSQATNANVNKYDYVYFEVVNFSTERACRVFFWDPNSNSRKDWYLRPVEGKDEVSDWGAPANVTGNGTYCVKIPSGARLQGAKTPWVQTPVEGSLFQFSKIYVIEPSDPLAGLKDILQQAIDKGNLVSSFGKTADSYKVLTDAISAGMTALESATAADELEDAAKAITDAIDGLELDGYVALTTDMFNVGGCSYEVFKASGLPYGDGNVAMTSYADLTYYSKLIVVTSSGTPRFCMNRLTADGQIASTQEDSKMLDINPNNKPDCAWATEKYCTKETLENNVSVFTVDLTAIVKDYGYAYLHCIKNQWGPELIVTDMLLEEATSIPVTIGAAGYATFCSKKPVALETDMEAYAVEFTGGTSATLIPVEGSVHANTPVILKAAAGDYELNIAESGTEPEKNNLKVSDGSVEGNGSVYVLANINDVVGFYLLAEGLKVPNGKAYLEASAGGREFIGFGEATAIKSVETVKADGAVYNLAGQQVKKAQKGIFIQNGKKVIK